MFPLSALGSASPVAAGPQWWLRLGVAWLCLFGWALLYATLLQRRLGVSMERSLCLASLCHLPLLLCLGLVSAVFADDPAGWVFASSPLGRQLYQPLARDYVIAAPLAAQALLWAGLRWRALARQWPLIAILLGSLTLRLYNAPWGLPGLLHPDEHRYIGPATMMVARQEFNPHYFQNPSLMIYLTALLFWLLRDHSVAFHLMDQFYALGIPDPRGDMLDMVVLRGLSGLAGTLTVLAVYLAGRELFGRRAGLLGAALLGVSFLHVRNSHYGTNDVLAVCFLAFSLFFSARLYRSRRISDYLLAALFGGLATSTKYSMGFFWLAMLVAHYGGVKGFRPGAPASWPRLLPTPSLLLGGVVSVAAFLAGTPYALLDSREFTAGFLSQYDLGAESWLGPNALPPALLYAAALVQGFGLVPLLLAALGVILALRRDRWRLSLVLSVPLVYLVFMLTRQLYFARFALPLLPYLALLAGYAVSRLPDRWGSRALSRPGLQVALVAVAALQPLLFSLQSDRLLGMDDTRKLAAEWIDRNTPADSFIAMEGFAHQDNKFLWTGYQGRETYVYWPENPEGRAKAMEWGYWFVVTSSFGRAPWQLEGAAPDTPVAPEYDRLKRDGRLVAVFAPGWGNGEIPHAQDDMYTPFWHLFERERPGPTVKIYRMPEAW